MRTEAQLNINRDNFAMLTKRPDMDGGDTANREGVYYSALSWLGFMDNGRCESSMSKLECPNKRGVYRRHPDPRYWYSHDNVMSRDQITPLIIAMGECKMFKRLFWAMLKWVCRLGFMNNTRRNGQYETKEEHFKSKYHHHEWDYSWKLPDFAPFHLGLYIRAFRCYPLWPLLCVLDFYLLINSLSKLARGRLYKKLPYNWHRKVTRSAECLSNAISLSRTWSFVTSIFLNTTSA